MFEWKKSAGKIYTLPVESIRPSPFQARTVFDEKELAGLAQSIRENGLLHGADFVDEYHGKQVPAGKKSVTIRLTIGSLEKTLTSTEIEECASGVIKKLTKRLGAELRTR